MSARKSHGTYRPSRVPTQEEQAQYEAMRETTRAAMRRVETINSALADLYDVAEDNVNRGLGDEALRAAVNTVQEARNG